MTREPHKQAKQFYALLRAYKYINWFRYTVEQRSCSHAPEPPRHCIRGQAPQTPSVPTCANSPPPRTAQGASHYAIHWILYKTRYYAQKRGYLPKWPSKSPVSSIAYCTHCRSPPHACKHESRAADCTKTYPEPGTGKLQAQTQTYDSTAEQTSTGQLKHM